VDVVVLEDCAVNIGFVGITLSQAVDGGGLVAERLQKRIRELMRVKRLFC